MTQLQHQIPIYKLGKGDNLSGICHKDFGLLVGQNQKLLEYKKLIGDLVIRGIENVVIVECDIGGSILCGRNSDKIPITNLFLDIYSIKHIGGSLVGHKSITILSEEEVQRLVNEKFGKLNCDHLTRNSQ